MTMRLSRRMLLRGATGAALALPLLNDVHGVRAQTMPAFPKRLIVVFTPNGTIPSAWASTGSGASFQPGTILTPFVTAGHKNDLIVVQGLDGKPAMDGPGGDAHGTAIGTLLTGTEVLSGMEFLAGCGLPGQFCGASGWPGGISIDQFIAKSVGTNTKFLTLDFSIKRMSGSIWSRMSYSEAAVPVTPMDDPGIAFDRIFADVGTDATTLARQSARRKSVIDTILGRYTSLSSSLSGADKMKVDAHLAALRDVESRVSVVDPVSGTCVKPMRPVLSASQEVMYNSSGMEVEDAAADVDVPQRNQLVRDLLVSSLACDLSRVGTLMLAPSRSDIFMNWLNINKSHHDLSHDPDSNTDSQQKLVQINQWYATQVASLVTSLKAVKEGSGTLFDNTVILWCNELGVGNNHSHLELPMLLIGSAGGYLKTGQAVTMPSGTPHNRLLLSLCHAMDMTDTTAFGNPKFCTDGPIQEIVA
ncbi:MAG TPA: DUF1552 domain-containing protein [Polyangiaceae bacterium]|nr:DUF1552 domain-containing protein [Polyangiaceae bacterium]